MTTYNISFENTIKDNETLSTRKEYIIVWKLFKVKIDIFIGPILVPIAGK